MLLQYVVLLPGPVTFQLNALPQAKPEGEYTRGKRALAKDRLYRHLLAEIRSLKPSSNPKNIHYRRAFSRRYVVNALSALAFRAEGIDSITP